jgi:hypothetical protein
MMIHMRVVGYHIMYGIKDSGMPVSDYTNLTSWTDKYSPN